MPLLSSHVFASHIGHTGKTTLCYQMSCYFAQRHPEIQVLVMDLAEEGDLSKRLLGGVDSSRVREELFGRVFTLFHAAGTVAERGRLTGWLFGRDLDLSEHTVRVRDHNASVPDNLHLISSGAWPREDEPMTLEARRAVADKIREALDRSPATWKLFCDTDGDRRPSPMTLMGYSLCEEAIVPLPLNKGDMDRTETMLGSLHEYRAAGEINTRVLFVVWNLVKSQKDEPMEHGSLSLPFTPTKISLSILDTCNERLVALARDEEMPGLFVHDAADEAAFLTSSTVLLRNLADNVLKPSEEIGMPFVHMIDELARSGKKTMRFPNDVTAAEAVITGTDIALRTIVEKFEAMSVG